MSISITIPLELEEMIAARAAEQGKDVEQFALEALSRAVASLSLRELFADAREQIRTSGVPEEEVNARIESAVKEVRDQRRA